jgi:predicted GNAT superfamily acetyltransferase
VLGAFLAGGEAVGMSFAFLGRLDDGRICLYSQLTGVVPGYQDRGLGFQLKTAQRAIARAEHVPCIAWAFDPLQAGNARFNLHKLGATAVRFIENMYGPRTDALNRNTPTDRLIAIWETEIDLPRSPDSATVRQAHRLITVERGVDGVLVPDPVSHPIPASRPTLLLEIPADVNRLRGERPELAERWGTAVRLAFVQAFGLGYRAVGFHRDDSPEERRCVYVLRK